MTKELALFDFDGTITTKDTLFDFIEFAVGKPGFYWGMLVVSPVLVAFAIKLLRNDVAKQKFLGHFFKGWSRQKFEEAGARYINERLDDILRPKAMEKLRWHKAQGHRVVLVSASIDSWIKGFCQREGIELLSTKMAEKDGFLLGRFDGANCHGQEKVNRIEGLLSLSEYDVVHAYGDSSGDKQMLAIADKPHYKPFE